MDRNQPPNLLKLQRDVEKLMVVVLGNAELSFPGLSANQRQILIDLAKVKDDAEKSVLYTRSTRSMVIGIMVVMAFILAALIVLLVPVFFGVG